MDREHIFTRCNIQTVVDAVAVPRVHRIASDRNNPTALVVSCPVRRAIVHAAIAAIAAACTSAESPTAAPSSAGPEYASVRAQLEAKRARLARDLDKHRARTLQRARELLVSTLRDDLLPAWDDTPWAMNGTSQRPHEGAIACGYFVSTTLLHAGFRVERAVLGQQASEDITRSLVTSEPIWRTSEQPIDAFITRLRRGGDGIYLVGLDNHVGFVLVDGPDTWFHHAAPGGVRRERAHTASFLSTSHYREAAKLFDDTLVEKWLRGTPIKTVIR